MEAKIWALDENRWALYTEDPEVAKLARQAGFHLMGTYYSPSSAVGPFAWQFAGPKEAVRAFTSPEQKKRELPARAQGVDSGKSTERR